MRMGAELLISIATNKLKISTLSPIMLVMPKTTTAQTTMARTMIQSPLHWAHQPSHRSASLRLHSPSALPKHRNRRYQGAS